MLAKDAMVQRGERKRNKVESNQFFALCLEMAAEAEGGAAVTQTRITQLEETLEAMAETLRYGIVILEDYKMENQEGLWSKM